MLGLQVRIYLSKGFCNLSFKVLSWAASCRGEVRGRPGWWQAMLTEKATGPVQQVIPTLVNPSVKLEMHPFKL